jgi:hypothetical protein
VYVNAGDEGDGGIIAIGIAIAIGSRPRPFGRPFDRLRVGSGLRRTRRACLPGGDLGAGMHRGPRIPSWEGQSGTQEGRNRRDGRSLGGMLLLTATAIAPLLPAVA